MASSNFSELKVNIDRTENVTPMGSKTYTNYIITFEDANRGAKWEIAQRYSDLNEFHHVLKKQFGDIAGFPRFPGKKFTNQLDPSFIEQRRAALESYLRAICFLQPILQSRELKHFIDSCPQRQTSHLDDIDLSELGRTLGLVDSPSLSHSSSPASLPSDSLHALVARGAREGVMRVLNVHPGHLERRDEAGQTPLAVAVLHKQRELAEELVMMGADLQATDQRGMTPLLLAAQNNDVQLLSLIVNNASSMRARDVIYENTVLHLLAQHPDSGVMGADRVFQMMLTKGVDVNAKNAVGNTPLHYAAQSGNLTLMKLLLDSRAAIDSANTDNESPLHFAARAGQPRAVQFLVQAGADVNLRGREGTPLELVYNKRAQRDRISSPVP